MATVKSAVIRIGLHSVYWSKVGTSVSTDPLWATQERTNL